MLNTTAGNFISQNRILHSIPYFIYNTGTNYVKDNNFTNIILG